MASQYMYVGKELILSSQLQFTYTHMLDGTYGSY